MRFTPIIPAVFTLVALVLSFLCLFAGSSPGYLESYDLLVVNTSRIGIDVFSASQATQTSAPTNTANNTGLLGWLQNATNVVSNLTQSVESQLEDQLNAALNDTLQSFARDLGLKDWYSFHVMDHCEGNYSPNGTANRNVTKCSGTDGLRPFNLTQTLEDELRNGIGLDITLQDIEWPAEVTEGFRKLRQAFTAIYVIYCILISLTLCALLLSLAALFWTGKAADTVSNVFVWLAAVLALVVSAVVTAAVDQAVENVNENAKQVNISAYRGSGFLGLTWATTVMLWLAGAVWATECALRRRKVGAASKEYQ